MTNDDLHGLDFKPALARCADCGRPAPILEEDVAGDGHGDPALDVVTPTPRGWCAELEEAVEHGDEGIQHDVGEHEFSEQIVCPDCATDEERTAQALEEAAADRAMRQAFREDGAPDDEPPDPDDDDPVAA